MWLFQMTSAVQGQVPLIPGSGITSAFADHRMHGGMWLFQMTSAVQGQVPLIPGSGITSAFAAEICPCEVDQPKQPFRPVLFEAHRCEYEQMWKSPRRSYIQCHIQLIRLPCQSCWIVYEPKTPFSNHIFILFAYFCQRTYYPFLTV